MPITVDDSEPIIADCAVNHEHTFDSYCPACRQPIERAEAKEPREPFFKRCRNFIREILSEIEIILARGSKR